MSRDTSRTATQTTWLSRVGRSKEHDRPTRTRTTVRRGERTASSKSDRARASVFRLQTSDFEHLLLVAQRKQSDGIARGGQPGRRRKTRTGSCSERRGASSRRKASRIVASHLLHGGWWKRSRSQGHHANRPAMAEAGSSGVTRRQRRSREWSETALRVRASKKRQRPDARAKTPPRHRTIRRSGSSAS